MKPMSGSAHYDCVSCGSGDTQRVSLAYDLGSTRGRSVTRAGDMFSRSGYGAITGTDTHTLLAGRIRPPRSHRVLAGSFVVLSLTLYVEALVHSRALLYGVWVPALAYAGWARWRNRQLAEEKDLWERQFVCLRCGHIFTPLS